MPQEERASWERAGNSFNVRMGLNEDVLVENLMLQYSADPVNAAFQPAPALQPALPIARPIQEATMAAIEGLLAARSEGICIALVQPPGMCTPLTALQSSLTISLRHGQDLVLSDPLCQDALRGGGGDSIETTARRSGHKRETTRF